MQSQKKINIAEAPKRNLENEVMEESLVTTPQIEISWHIKITTM